MVCCGIFLRYEMWPASKIVEDFVLLVIAMEAKMHTGLQLWMPHKYRIVC